MYVNLLYIYIYMGTGVYGAPWFFDFYTSSGFTIAIPPVIGIVLRIVNRSVTSIIIVILMVMGGGREL